MALVAVGGYGRGELAPFSDIDLLFLLPYKQTPHTEQVVEYHALLAVGSGAQGRAGDALGRARCLRYAKADLTIRTAMLEARYVWGEQALFTELKTRVRGRDRQAAPRREFVEAKLAERDAAPPAARRQPLSASSPTSRRARAGCATCTRCSGSPNTSTASTTSAKLVELKRAVGRGGAALRARPEFPVDGALPPAFPRRPRRGAPDLRPADRDRRAAWATPTMPARAASSAS